MPKRSRTKASISAVIASPYGSLVEERDPGRQPPRPGGRTTNAPGVKVFGGDETDATSIDGREPRAPLRGSRDHPIGEGESRSGGAPGVDTRSHHAAGTLESA